MAARRARDTWAPVARTRVPPDMGFLVVLPQGGVGSRETRPVGVDQLRAVQVRTGVPTQWTLLSVILLKS